MSTAVAAAVPASARGGELGGGLLDARRAGRRAGSCSPMMPVEQTATSIAPQRQDLGGLLGGGVRGLEALRPGARVGAARVEDDGAQRAAGEHLP